MRGMPTVGVAFTTRSDDRRSMAIDGFLVFWEIMFRNKFFRQIMLKISNFFYFLFTGIHRDSARPALREIREIERFWTGHTYFWGFLSVRNPLRSAGHAGYIVTRAVVGVVVENRTEARSRQSSDVLQSES